MHLTLDMAFLGNEISGNLAKTPEGFLICRNVKISRTGVYYYLGKELGLKGPESDKVVKVYRLAKDVLTPEALKSFEGKPFTDDHPPEEVNPENYRDLDKGHLQNVRSDGVHMICDVVAKDASVIRYIETNKKREVSAGYKAVYVRYKDGYRQTRITGNHLALVDKGRAGPSIRINDSLNKGVKNRMPTNKKAFNAKVLAACAQTMSDDELADVMEVLSTDAAPVVTEPPKANKNNLGGVRALLGMILNKDEESKPKETEDEDDDEEKEKGKETADSKFVKSVNDRFTQLESGMAEILKALKGGKTQTADSDTDELDAWLTDSEEEEEEKPKETEDEDDDEEGDGKKETSDAALRELLAELKPQIAKLPKAKQQLFKDSFRKRLGKGAGQEASPYAGIKISTADRKTIESRAEKMLGLGERIAAKYNPQYKKQ